MYTAQVITVSDRSFRGERPDGSGPVVRALLEAAGYQVGEVVIIPDEQPLIEEALIKAAQADIARLDMQRYFYQGLFARIRTATVWDLAKLAPVALKYVETNIPMDELISMGVSFLQVDSANIMMCKLPTYSAAQRYNDQSHLICDVAKTTDLLNQYFRTYGGPVDQLDVPTLATVGESTDPNVQYMGQLDTEAEAGQAGG